MAAEAQHQEVSVRGCWLGEWCKGCDRRVVVGFSVPDEDWEAVVGGEFNILCLACFDERAEAKGVRYTVLDTVRPIAWWEWEDHG